VAGIDRSPIVVAAFVMGFASQAEAQAFIPAAADGTVSVSYQAAFTCGQVDSAGQLVGPNDTTDGWDFIGGHNSIRSGEGITARSASSTID